MISKDDNETNKGELLSSSPPPGMNGDSDQPTDADTINNVDFTHFSIKNARQLIIQYAFAVACCLLIFHKAGTITSQLDILNLGMEVLTLVSFFYNISQLVDRVRFMFAGKFADVQPTLKFIYSRMGYVIDKNVAIELNSKFGYALMGGAVILGFYDLTWANPNLFQPPPAELLLELAELSIQWLSTTFQVMFASIALIIFAKNPTIMSLGTVQEKESIESELTSGQAFKTQLEILKMIMAAVRMWIMVYYWLLWGYDMLLESFEDDGGVETLNFFVRGVLGILSMGLAYCYL